MKMLRGALAFFALIALFSLWQCRQETGSDVTATSNDRSAALRAAVKKQCVDPGQLCPEPCDIKVTVDEATPVAKVDSTQQKVYLAENQAVSWHAELEYESKDPADKAEIKRVHFLKKNEPAHAGKTNSNDAKADPNCSKPNKCVSTATAFDPCKTYKYYVVVHHHHNNNDEDKESDPEIEVAGTTPLGTQGTSDTTGTH